MVFAACPAKRQLEAARKANVTVRNSALADGPRSRASPTSGMLRSHASDTLPIAWLTAAHTPSSTPGPQHGRSSFCENVTNYFGCSVLGKHFYPTEHAPHSLSSVWQRIKRHLANVFEQSVKIISEMTGLLAMMKCLCSN